MFFDQALGEQPPIARQYVRLPGTHKCRYGALLLYPWVVWGGLIRVAPCLLLGFWAT